MKKYSTPTMELQVIRSEDIMALSTESKFVGLGTVGSYAGDRIDFSEYMNF